jgi:transcriptional regulator
MYIPKYYKVDDPEVVRDFIHENGFATLISQVGGRPWATHVPLVLDTEPGRKDVLAGHISKANKQWKEFSSHEEVLAVFLGPNAYISSSWYDHENVPTWNYLAVHVYGHIRIIEGEALKRQLGRLVNKYEAGLENPVSVERMSANFLEKEIAGIIGFEIEITEIQAASKLSQNRDEKNYVNILHGLEKKGDPASLKMAEMMRRRMKRS